MDSDTQLLQQLVAGQARIEGKLDFLIAALAEDGEQPGNQQPLEPSDPK